MRERKRRANAPVPRTHSHRVSVTPEEEGRLLLLAQAEGVTVPRLLYEAATGTRNLMTATERRDLLAELFRLDRLLMTIANNANQMAVRLNAEGQEPTQAAVEALRDLARRTSDDVVAAVGRLR
jgi:hypothetical protein